MLISVPQMVLTLCLTFSNHFSTTKCPPLNQRGSAWHGNNQRPAFPYNCPTHIPAWGKASSVPRGEHISLFPPYFACLAPHIPEGPRHPAVYQQRGWLCGGSVSWLDLRSEYICAAVCSNVCLL